MKNRIAQFLGIWFVMLWLTSCSNGNSTPGPTIAPAAVTTVPAPTATVAATTRPSTLTPPALFTLAPGAQGPDLAEALKIFPLLPGARWLYTEVDYTQTGDPNQMISAAVSIEDRVADVQNQPPYYVAHIQRTASLVRADAELDQIGVMTRPGRSEYWYILIHGRVYQSQDRPDLLNLHLDQLSEELNLPLKQNLSWCPRKMGEIAPQPQETPIPCQFVGARTVIAEQPFETQAGAFASCFQLQDAYNGGPPLLRFCSGVGFVSEEFRHAGTIFGHSKWLVEYKPGTAP